MEGFGESSEPLSQGEVSMIYLCGVIFATLGEVSRVHTWTPGVIGIKGFRYNLETVSSRLNFS